MYVEWTSDEVSSTIHNQLDAHVSRDADLVYEEQISEDVRLRYSPLLCSYGLCSFLKTISSCVVLSI